METVNIARLVMHPGRVLSGTRIMLNSARDTKALLLVSGSSEIKTKVPKVTIATIIGTEVTANMMKTWYDA